MREKQQKCIVTFPTTTGAMAMEKACKEEEVPGRLIPIPRSISAGCGMCWAAPAESRDAIEDLVVRRKLMIDGLYDILL